MGITLEDVWARGVVEVKRSCLGSLGGFDSLMLEGFGGLMALRKTCEHVFGVITKERKTSINSLWDLACQPWRISPWIHRSWMLDLNCLFGNCSSMFLSLSLSTRSILGGVQPISIHHQLTDQGSGGLYSQPGTWHWLPWKQTMAWTMASGDNLSATVRSKRSAGSTSWHRSWTGGKHGKYSPVHWFAFEVCDCQTQTKLIQTIS